MSAYERLKQRMAELHHLHSALALMEWDLETHMPPQGVEYRSEVIAYLTKEIHDRFTHPETKALVEAALGEDLDELQRRNVLVLKEDYERAVRLPAEHVAEVSRTTAKAFAVWQEAKKKADFSLFKPYLARIIELKRREIELKGWEGHPYNALLQDFDRSATVDIIDRAFEELKGDYMDMVHQFLDKEHEIDDSFLHQYFDPDKERALTDYVLTKLGFPFDKGRLDYSPHPFSIGIGPNDVRITTRKHDHLFGEMLLSSIHEMGHALYDLGLPKDSLGMPASEATSLSIHESQSRFWENYIGRSLPFWEHFYVAAESYFYPQFRGKSLWEFYRALNKVRRHPIRIESDELTYHFHIIIRYELERALIEGNMNVDDLPAEWNRRYEAYLGIKVRNDAEGVLQDVHWAHGSIGYFPTYSLGTFYAAQFMFAIERAIPDIWDQVRNGDFAAFHEWLYDNVWSIGRLFTSEEIAQQATGEGLNVHYFVQYVRNKFLPLYEAKVPIG